MHKSIAGLLLVSVFVLLTGCASVMTPGRFRPVPVKTYPAGASVYLNDAFEGTAPLSLRVDRKGTHRLEIRQSGFETFRKEIKPGSNGWIWGNLLFGGIIGIVVDAVNGSNVTPKPGKFAVYLLPYGGDYADRQQTKAAKKAWKDGGAVTTRLPPPVYRRPPPAAAVVAQPEPERRTRSQEPQRSLKDYRSID